MSDEDPAQVAEETPSRLSDEERAEVLRLVHDLFGIDTSGATDTLIDMPMIAQLAGVAPGTPGAWQQRTKTGKERVPFPEPSDPRYTDKPQWYAVQLVETFLKPSGRWPRGAVARLGTRRERPQTRRAHSATDKIGMSGLRRTDAELAGQLEQLELNDGAARTVTAWKRRLAAAQRAAAKS